MVMLGKRGGQSASASWRSKLLFRAPYGAKDQEKSDIGPQLILQTAFQIDYISGEMVGKSFMSFKRFF